MISISMLNGTIVVFITIRINHLTPMYHFYNPWVCQKTSGYTNETLAWNGLIDSEAVYWRCFANPILENFAKLTTIHLQRSNNSSAVVCLGKMFLNSISIKHAGIATIINQRSFTKDSRNKVKIVLWDPRHSPCHKTNHIYRKK